MLADPTVGGGERRAALIGHLVRETLVGRGARLKGTAIAIDVFGRGNDFDPQTDAVVRTEARRLRQALDSYYAGAGADDPIRIVIPKGSYVPRFEARHTPLEVPEADESAAAPPPVGPEPAGPVRPAAPPAGPAAARRRNGLLAAGRPIAAAVAVVAILSTVILLLLRGDERPGQAPGETALPPSVLVTPFEAAGSAPDVDALAAGITAELIADLMRFADLRLYTFQDSLRRDADGTGAHALDGVDFAVSGIVRGDRDQLSVVVRVVEAASGRILWSDAYARPLRPAALVELQTELAGEIASAIGQPYGVVRTVLAERLAVGAGGAQMPSFACVMQAYTYRHTNRRELYAPARACLEEAVVRDPQYAEAWAMLAYLRLDGERFGYDTGAPGSRGEGYAAARAAAARALALEPQSVQALKALSTIEFYSGNYADSHRLAREALELNPNDPDTLGQLGWRLGVRGNFDAALPYLEHAIARSVRPPPWYFQPIALERLMAGDMAGMLTAAERASVDGSGPSAALLAIAYGGLGQEEAARTALRAMAQKWPLLARDPDRALAIHHVAEDIIAAFRNGLEAAGWRPPVSQAAETTGPSADR